MYQVQIPYTGKLPEKGRPEDAAYDLRALEQHTLQPGEVKLIPTGFNMAIPQGYVGLVCPRSGLALKWGVTVLNSPGVIDPSYIGDVSVILINLGKYPFTANAGDRIAQLLIQPTADATFHEAHGGLQESAGGSRGTQGFGSSGVA